MQQNSYIGLLDVDSIKIKHPITQVEIKLYRVIALKSFRLELYNYENPEAPIQRTIRQHSIGGWVQSLKNLDENNPVWIDHRVRVFDDAKVINGSLISENCLIYENAIVDSSISKDYVRIHGNAKITHSKISGLAEVKGYANIEHSLLENSAMVFENATVRHSRLSIGSCVRGSAIVTNCTLTDISQIQGTANVTNCLLQGRSSLSEGVYLNQTFDEDDNLKIEYVEPEEVS